VVAQMCDNNMLLAAIKQGHTEVQEMKKSVITNLKMGLRRRARRASWPFRN